MKVIAIIPSAGQGLRMQTEVEKPYIRIGGRPILAHTLDVLDQCPFVDGYIIVVEPSKQEACRHEIVDAFGYQRVLDVVAGGATRQESVFNGLMTLDVDTDVVLIHDAARPWTEGLPDAEEGSSDLLDTGHHAQRPRAPIHKERGLQVRRGCLHDQALQPAGPDPPGGGGAAGA